MANKKVRMRVRISGSRDGVDWPAAGEDITVSAAEAGDLIRQGFAIDPAAPVENALADVRGVETAVVPASSRNAAQKSIRAQRAAK